MSRSEFHRPDNCPALWLLTRPDRYNTRFRLKKKDGGLAFTYPDLSFSDFTASAPVNRVINCILTDVEYVPPANDSIALLSADQSPALPSALPPDPPSQNLPQSPLQVATLGTPRIGLHRELKTALEAFWAGKITAPALLATAAELRRLNWARQQQRGVTILPSNDFSLYDQVLDTCALFGVVPAAYGWKPSDGDVPLATYFAMARGRQQRQPLGQDVAVDVPALEMTKWYDTNYHFIVPDFGGPDQTFALASSKPIDEFLEAKALGYHTRPVLIGPVTFLKLGKSTTSPTFDPLALLPRLLPVYATLLSKLAAAGADWVQIDEPALVLDLSDAERAAVASAFDFFAGQAPTLRILLATYFGPLQGANLATVASLPVAGLHLDIVRATKAQAAEALASWPRAKIVSLGVIDGRNIWRADLQHLVDEVVKPIVAARGAEKVQLGPSCSLLHTPVDLDLEPGLGSVKQWLSFSLQKMTELSAIAHAASAADLSALPAAVRETLEASAVATASRKSSTLIHNPSVAAAVAAVSQSMYLRRSPFTERASVQRAEHRLPAFPTTTIGSFPQTAEIRKARASFAAGTITEAHYNQFLREETARAIIWQEEVGLDVLVHGEFERNDMVQYFAEQLNGYAFTVNGWVQSYGSRCVRPPVLYGDVSRPKAMSVAWWAYAQSLTARPVKGMLTGPVTMLNWSFVRDDLPRSAVCKQLALAIRGEVSDLEAAGAKMIQIDEAALREGLPLLKSGWPEYLQWAVDSFRLCASGVADKTQIHTHMCYSEFNAIISDIARLDADVISIESSRSKMDLLDAFKTCQYPNEIGPGVYDIHSPRIPEVKEMVVLMELAKERLAVGQLWINPDCGLKTRRWEEVRPALLNMVEAARQLRA